MGEELREKKIRLEKQLSLDGFECEFPLSSTTKLDEPVFLIKNYRPTETDIPISFAFTLQHYYYSADDNSLGKVFWATHQKLKASGQTSKPYGDGPRPHPDCREFFHDGKKYHHYSAQLDAPVIDGVPVLAFSFENLQDLGITLCSLYQDLTSIPGRTV